MATPVIAQPLPSQPAPPPPPVLLADVRIQDYRGLSDLAISLEPLTLFVGENNCGKSSVLQALAVFFGTQRATEDDLHVDAKGQRAARFVIDVRFVPGAGVKFEPDVQARLIGKVQVPSDTTQPQFFTMRAIGEVALDGSGISLDRRFIRGWADDRAAATALTVLPERPGREHLELVNFFLLDARRDLVEELRNRTSHWGRLLADLGLDPQTRTEIEEALEKVGTAIVDSSPVLGSVRTGLSGVKEALGGSVSDVKISPVPGRIDDLARAVDVLVARPTGPALPLRLQGHGSRSLAAVMVFEAFVKKRAKAGGVVAPLIVSAFEEPEAHLHPQAHRAMLGLIAGLEGQKLVSTHSPYVTRVADIHSVRSITRLGGVPQCKAVPRHSSGKPTFTDAEMLNVKRFVQRNNGEILFARAVVVIEGDTEDFALPIFARRHWGKDHGLMAVSFAHTDGAMNGQHVVRLLEMLGIPWVLLADGDGRGTDGIAAIENVLNRKLVPDEFVQLPNGAFFEKYLIDAGYRSVIEQAIGTNIGATVLADSKARWHGRLGPGGVPRDYNSPGWEDRLLCDFCVSRKGKIGEVLANGIVELAPAAGLAAIPPMIEQVFVKAHKWLK
jgi:putative ATP-dependent endonuclease of OLD family